jgi:hypothetical protein
VRYWRLLGLYNAETTAYTAFAGVPPSPYTPDEDARLSGLRCVNNRDGATTLANHTQIRLTCNTFKPNSIECGAQGSGLQTAPVGVVESQDWQVDQVVKAGVPITLEGRNVTADTPVGVSVLLYGLFQN